MSWKGGPFEHLLSLIKSALNSSVQRKTLTWQDLYMVLKEMQSILNARPLTHVGDDHSLDTLTPNKLFFRHDTYLSFIFNNLREQEWNAPIPNAFRRSYNTTA